MQAGSLCKRSSMRRPHHRKQVVAVQALHKAGHLLHPSSDGAWGAATAHLHPVRSMRWWQGTCRSSLQRLKLAGMHRYGVATVPRRGLSQPTPTVGGSFINPEGHHLPAPAPATALGANPQCSSVPPHLHSWSLTAHRLIDQVPCHDGWVLAVPPPRDGVGAGNNGPAAGRQWWPCLQLCGEAGANISQAERWPVCGGRTGPAAGAGGVPNVPCAVLCCAVLCCAVR